MTEINLNITYRSRTYVSSFIYSVITPYFEIMFNNIDDARIFREWGNQKIFLQIYILFITVFLHGALSRTSV
jgi:hypothetical protein